MPSSLGILRHCLYELGASLSLPIVRGPHCDGMARINAGRGQDLAIPVKTHRSALGHVGWLSGGELVVLLGGVRNGKGFAMFSEAGRDFLATTSAGEFE